MLDSSQDKFKVEEKLGHILVQTLMMINNGYKATQGEIKKKLGSRGDAPTIKNISYLLDMLVEGRFPGKTKIRSQTNNAWLTINHREISFLDKEKVLSDFRACAGLLYALRQTYYTGSFHAFDIKKLEDFLSEKFQVNEKLLQLFLKDFRRCGYTAESIGDKNREQIYIDTINRETFFLEIASQNKLLVKDYSKQKSND